MPLFLENFGLDFFKEDEETYCGLLGYLAENGKGITGYYGRPTLCNTLGNVDLYVKTEKAEGGFEIVGLDTHCSGPHVWTMEVLEPNINPKDALPTEKLMMFRSQADRGGLLPIHLLNADVLPSLLEGDVVQMQMTALPLDIKYYETEEAFVEEQPVAKDGKKWMIADGTFFPMQFLHNHRVNKPEDEETNYSSDDIVLFKATVQEVYLGKFSLGDHSDYTFIRCIAETNHGGIIFAHTIDQVEEKYRNNIKEGAIISGTCVLSGDVGIFEYDHGIVKTAENALRCMRQVLLKGETERLRPILAENAVYDSVSTENKYTGADAIIDRFNFIYKANKRTLYAHPATITRTDSEELAYGVGTQCLVLSYNEEENYDSILFLDVDAEGNITKIRVDNDSRYHFHIKTKDSPNESTEDEPTA